MPVNNLIQMRRGTAAAWTSANPTLATGEIGFETDTYKIKIGDSSAAWNSLAYFAPSGGGTVASVTARDTSIVVGGTADDPTIETATLDVIAADHPPAADWSNNSHKITSVADPTSAQDAATKSYVDGAGGGSLAVSFIKRTAGDLSITNDSSFHDVPTIGDLTIAAAVGDVLMISLNGTVDNNMRFEVQFPNGSNYAGPGITSTQGISGWAARTSAAANVGGVIYYTVVSGDISGGNVLCRLRYTTTSSGATKIFASTAVGPLIFGVVNLAH